MSIERMYMYILDENSTIERVSWDCGLGGNECLEEGRELGYQKLYPIEHYNFIDSSLYL